MANRVLYMNGKDKAYLTVPSGFAVPTYIGLKDEEGNLVNFALIQKT